MKWTVDTGTSLPKNNQFFSLIARKRKKCDKGKNFEEKGHIEKQINHISKNFQARKQFEMQDFLFCETMSCTIAIY